MDFQNHDTTVFYRYPGVYGLVPPAILSATVVRVYDNWTGTRVIIQPEGLATRDIPVADVITHDPANDEFDAAREVEHRAAMEARVTRTPLGVTFELRPGDTDELLWAAKRVLHGDDYNPNGGFHYRQSTGGGSLRGWQISGGYRGG